MSITQRRKGAEGERQVVRCFRAAGWPHAERTARGVAQAGRSDIANGPAGCAVEVKWQERLNIPKALDQLRRDANALDIPLLVHRPSRHDWMVTLPLTDLLPLLLLRERG